MIASHRYLAVYIPSKHTADRWNLFQVYSDIYLEDVMEIYDVVIEETFKVMKSTTCNFKDSVLGEELEDA